MWLGMNTTTTRRPLWTPVLSVCAPSRVCPPPSKNKATIRNFASPDSRVRRKPRLRGDPQLYVNVAICPAAAPLPLGRSWAARLASGRCEEQMGRKLVFTYQGPAPRTLLQDESGVPLAAA